MYFFQSKIVLDIHKGVEDMNKAKKKKRVKGKFRRGGRGSFNRSTSRPHKVKQSISYIDNGNLKSKFDKSKAKCYNCQKISHYDRDCWSPTERIDKNANLVI